MRDWKEGMKTQSGPGGEREKKSYTNTCLQKKKRGGESKGGATQGGESHHGAK